jgi:hypothetical protein
MHATADRLRELAIGLEQKYKIGTSPLSVADAAEILLAIAEALDPPFAGGPDWTCKNCLATNTGPFCGGCGREWGEPIVRHCPDCESQEECDTPDESPEGFIYCLSCGTVFLDPQHVAGAAPSAR